MSFETNNLLSAGLADIVVVLSASAAELNDSRRVNSQVLEMRAALSRLGFNVRTLVFCRSSDGGLDKNAGASADDRITVGHGGVYRSLAQAIEAASQETPDATLAIVDLATASSVFDWQWIVNSIDSVDVACCFHKFPCRGGKLSRVANFASDHLSRLLMRTGKTGTRPGIVAFSSVVMQHLFRTGAADAVAAEELVAFCHYDKRKIAEAELCSVNETIAIDVSLKSALVSAGNRLRFWWDALAFPQRFEASPAFPNSWTRKQWLVTLGIAMLASLMFFTNLGYPLLEPDESRNAQLGLNVYQTGEWMSLMIDGEYYWDKPPLQAWMTAASYHVFGASEFTARLPSAATSLICVLAILFLGSRLFCFRTASVAAIALILSSGFTVVARYITMDASLCCFATVMFLAILLATQSTAGALRKRWLVVAGVACGLGLLAKGPVIGVIVMPPVLIAAWLQRKSFYANPRFWMYLLAPAALIAAPWFLAMSIVHPDFMEYFFWKHHVVRFADAFNHEQPWWFYLPAVLIMTYPSVLLLPQLFRLLRTSDRESRKAFGGSFGYLLIYVLWVVGFFSLSDAKLPTYILPCVPVLCLLMGRAVELGLGAQPAFAPIQKELSAVPQRLAVSVAIMMAVSMTVVAVKFSVEGMLFFAIAAVAMPACIVLVLVTLRKSSNLPKSFVPAIAAGVIFMLVCNGLLLPTIADARSSQHAIKRLAESQEFLNSTVVYFGRPPRGTFFTIPNVDVNHFSDKCRLKAVQFLASHPNSIVIASKDDVETLQQEMNVSHEFESRKGHRKMYICRTKVDHDDTGSSFRLADKLLAEALLDLSKKAFVCFGADWTESAEDGHPPIVAQARRNSGIKYSSQ